MALPKILQKLFANSGAGPKLREDIMPRDYLTTAGGTMSGQIVNNVGDLIRGLNSSGWLSFKGGTDDAHGAGIVLYGKDHETQGSFNLIACDGTNSSNLIGRANGTLLWNGNSLALAKDYLPLSGGTLNGGVWLNNAGIWNASDNSWTFISGGTGADSAGLQLYGKEQNGAFSLWAKKDGASAALIGYPNGALFWSDKAVERINSYGTGYIRYESGLQICFGRVDITVGATTASWGFTFPVAFSSTPYVTTDCHAGHRAVITGGAEAANPTHTSGYFMSSASESSSGYVDIVAIGFWK